MGLASGKIYFSETFGDGWENCWTASKWRERERERAKGTLGKFVPATGKWFNNEFEDKGIHMSEGSKFIDISAGFESFSNEGKAWPQI